MLELRVVVDKECAECLVYQHQESSLRGKLFIKTGDKLKLRQITIRLVSTELVDIHENSELTPAEVAASNGFLQKSTRTIGTWVVLAKSGDTHVLGVGEHQYSFEIALPKGLDGTVDTGAYRLGYELESRVEHSFVLKPASVMMTPVTLVQVPMGLNLHSDDRVSMNIVPDVLLSRSLVPEDVPLGRAVCVHADAIDQGKEFVLRHLWDSALAVRLRLPRGRVFPTDAYATVDIQAVPITREYRCTRVTLRLEEISIIARPQRSQPAAVRQASTRARPASSSLAPLRRHSVANSAMSNSSSDSVAGAARGDNAAAYAQECSAEYQNAITKVRTLATASHTAWPERPSVSLAEFSGIASARLRLHVSAADRAHTDIRNSHIQVHHQIAYEVRYERVQAAESSDARILAVAKVYGALANANIVRRDELRNLEVVRGTLPVAVVPKKISALWGLKNIDYDNDPEDDEPNAFPVPNTTESHLVDLAADAAAASYVPSSAMLDMMHSNEGYATAMPSTSGSAMPAMPTMPTMPGMPTIPGVPGMPTMPGIPTMSSFAAMPTVPGIPGIPGIPGGSYMPAAPASQPMGFNPMLMPPAPLGFGMGGPSADMNYMGYNGPSVDTSYNMAYGNNAGYNPMLQQQILMFQEQQRMQQQQFFQQLTEQYGQMAVSPVPQRTEPQNSAYTYGPAPPPPPTARSEVLLPVVQEPTSYVTNAAAIEVPSVPAVVVPTVVVEPADTIIETATVSETATEAASVSDSVAPETSRPDSAADTSSAADQQLTSITTAIEHSTAEASNAPALQPLTHSQSNTAISEHNDTATGRHSPPPNYDDLLPPDYEVPANQPPPYRPMESNRSRNRMWGV